MPQVLVLGAAGAIGAHVVRVLGDSGWRIRAFVRPATDTRALEGLDVDVAIGDARDEHSVRAALNGCDALVHAAGFYPRGPLSVARAAHEGVATVAPVLRAALAAGIGRAVYVSSAATLGPGRRPSPRPGKSKVADPRVRFADEADPPPVPRGPYTAAKLAMERAALDAAAAGLPLVVVNPTLCLGEHDRKPTSGRLVVAILRGRLPAVPDAPLNVVWTGDVARGIAAALERGGVGRRYALGGANTTLPWLARQIAFEGGVRPPATVPFPARAAGFLRPLGATVGALRPRAGAMLAGPGLELLAAAQHVDTTRAARELDLLPVLPAVQTVRRTVAWFRAELAAQTAR